MPREDNRVLTDRGRKEDFIDRTIHAQNKAIRALAEGKMVQIVQEAE